MSDQILQERFTTALFDILDETFETHHGIYLDEDTSLFTTLESISAAEASLPVGGRCATLAAQVAHVNFQLEVLEKYILKKDSGNVDWGDIWRRVNKVSPQAWTALKEQLKQTYQRVQDIPLLEHAQHPVAVYPDETLKATALERGWEIIGDTPAYP